MLPMFANEAAKILVKYTIVYMPFWDLELFKSYIEQPSVLLTLTTLVFKNQLDTEVFLHSWLFDAISINAYNNNQCWMIFNNSCL